MVDQSLSIRRIVLTGVAGGLSLAAITAIAALLSGGGGDVYGQVIATSLCFSLGTLMAAPGGVLLQRRAGAARALGGSTAALAIVALVLSLVLIWLSGDLDDALVRAWAVAVLAALASSHAALMVGALRPGDTTVVRRLSQTSIALGSADALAAILAVLEIIDEPSDGTVRLFAVGIVLLLLTTALPPILRRLGTDRGPATVAAPGPVDLTQVAADLERIAERLERRDALASGDAAVLRDIAGRLAGAAASD